jgi:uncharacterized protein YecE (DUF72 family)
MRATHAQKHPDRHSLVGRSIADKVWGVLPVRREVARSAAAVLRLAISVSGGGQPLLRDSERPNRKAVGRRTPDQFVFDVKAFRALTTHHTQPKSLPKYIAASLPDKTKKTVYYKDLPNELTDALWSEFRNALVPLKQARKLGVVLFQFPPWFTPSPENRAHLDQCMERMHGFTLAVEFRNATWFGERGTAKTLKMLRDYGAAHVIVDEPRGFKSSIPAVWEATADVAVLRLHGRNHDTWEKKGLKAASERFDYYYTKPELDELVLPIKSVAKKAQTVHVVVNTNRADQGPANARLLQEALLGG